MISLLYSSECFFANFFNSFTIPRNVTLSTSLVSSSSSCIAITIVFAFLLFTQKQVCICLKQKIYGVCLYAIKIKLLLVASFRLILGPKCEQDLRDCGSLCWREAQVYQPVLSLGERSGVQTLFPLMIKRWTLFNSVC